MLEYKQKGHVTDDDLRCLTEEHATEEQRLEISEHLSNCMSCTERYLAILEQAPLYEVAVASKVQRRIAKKKWAVVLGRYATVGTAACFAVIVYFSSLLTTQYSSSISQSILEKQSLQSLSLQWSSNITDTLQAIPESVQKALTFEFIDSELFLQESTNDDLNEENTNETK